MRRPYVHLVDGGVSDNVGMRAVLDSLEVVEALHEAGRPTPLDSGKRIIVFVVNSLSSPPTNWDESESSAWHRGHPAQVRGHSDRRLFLRVRRIVEGQGGAVAAVRLFRNFAAYAANKDPAVAAALRIPDAEIYAIDVSFPALKDKAELDYLNTQPTSFVLPAEGVDRLRAAAGTIIMASPEFQRLLKDVGATILADPPRAGAADPAAQ